jgi:hypothetical protein
MNALAVAEELPVLPLGWRRPTRSQFLSHEFTTSTPDSANGPMRASGQRGLRDAGPA